MVSTQWAPLSITMPQPPSLRSVRQCQLGVLAGSCQPALMAHQGAGIAD